MNNTESKVSDKELLQELMNYNNWTRTQLANELGFDRANVTRIFADKQKLSNTSRKLAELLLQQTEE